MLIASVVVPPLYLEGLYGIIFVPTILGFLATPFIFSSFYLITLDSTVFQALVQSLRSFGKHIWIGLLLTALIGMLQFFLPVFYWGLDPIFYGGGSSEPWQHPLTVPFLNVELGVAGLGYVILSSLLGAGVLTLMIAMVGYMQLQKELADLG